MKTFPKDIHFKYTWRRYQKRVLDELSTHLNDQHLHIVAPPGSGKTVLGLEVVLRINGPTLILAPTIAIRDQWIQRFCALFLRTHQTPDWISRDIRNPKFMTVTTYQGLHSASNDTFTAENHDEPEKPEGLNTKLRYTHNHHRSSKEIVKKLREVGVTTIVVDEAHHLKNEWWQSLIRIKDKLNPVVVGLTATPPYDVSPLEWHRYMTLTGPFDTEISVPELVKEGNLCPHQDYIHLSTPTEQERKVIQNFREDSNDLFNEIRKDETLISAITSHPIWINPQRNLELIYGNISFYSASVIFLHSNEISISEEHLRVISPKSIAIPPLDYQWMACLLQWYLFEQKDVADDFDSHRTALENRLRRHGLLEGKRVSFTKSKRVDSGLVSSLSKLNGIKEIVSSEYQHLGTSMRMVILSDFIRKEYFPITDDNRLEIKKIGVIPIFETLRRERMNGLKLGVLTGSIVIIPQTALAAFQEKLKLYGIYDCATFPVRFDDQYVVVNQNESLKQVMIHVITQIFEEGEIEVLVGTKALLGEGWDAPAINSLILASFVGSFVSSNQMRGRAIRTQLGNPEKTASIWHLACIDPTSDNAGEDLRLLRRRFRSFMGISASEPTVIENGIRRVMDKEALDSPSNIQHFNQQNLASSRSRNDLRQRWESGIQEGIKLVEEIEVPFYEEKGYQAVKSMQLQKTIVNFTGTLASAVVFYLEVVLEILFQVKRWIRTFHDAYIVLTLIGVFGLVFFGYRTFRALRLYISYRDIAKDLKSIGDAVLHSLIQTNHVQTNRNNLHVISTMNEDGSVQCHLEGGTTFEKSIFIQTIEEIVSPVENQRYLMIRKSKFMGFLNQRDYHGVPEIFGRNIKTAEYFKKQWKENVGDCELVYARSFEGRQRLLASRMKSLASQLEPKTVRVSKWT